MFSISQTGSQLLKMKPKPIILIIHFSVNGNLFKSGSFPNCEEEAECLCSYYGFSPHDSPTGKWVWTMDMDRCHSWAAQYWASPPSDEYWWSINNTEHLNKLTLTWQQIVQESEWPNSSRQFNSTGQGMRDAGASLTFLAACLRTGAWERGKGQKGPGTYLTL